MSALPATAETTGISARRFVAPDMSRALKAVRDALGPDAIILSNQRVADGVEIVATLEMPQETPEVKARHGLRNQFKAGFDADWDQPLASDTDWAFHHEAQALAATAGVKPAVAKPKASAETQARSRQLADEFQIAHEKMLAAGAKPLGSASHAGTPIASRQVPLHGDLEGRSFEGRGLEERGAVKGAKPQRHPADTSRSASVAPKTKADAALEPLQGEIAQLRLLIEEQLWQHSLLQNKMLQGTQAPTRDWDALSPRAQQLAQQLQSLGLPLACVQRLACKMRAEVRLTVAWREALATLAQQLVVRRDDPVAVGGRFALLGPTGVGKTTTLAKLASRYVLREGRGKVALVTTDSYRVGAQDQLRALGRILQLPVRVLEPGMSLAATLASLDGFPLVLVDTAGFRQGDPRLAAQSAQLAACPALKPLLVLAANSQAAVQKATWHAYGHSCPLAGCVLTKLDETLSLGESVGVLAEVRLPLWYTAAGQEIPDDLAPASASDLIAQLVKLSRQGTLVSSALHPA